MWRGGLEEVTRGENTVSLAMTLRLGDVIPAHIYRLADVFIARFVHHGGAPELVWFLAGSFFVGAA